jgi:hypothetical protein
MRQAKERTLVQWSEKDAKAELCKVVVQMNVGEGGSTMIKKEN